MASACVSVAEFVDTQPPSAAAAPPPVEPQYRRLIRAMKPLLRSEEWWAVWVGFAFLISIWIIVQVYGLHFPQMLPWMSRPWMAYASKHILIGLPLLLVAMVGAILISFYFTNPYVFHIKWTLGLLFLWFLSLVSKNIGAQVWVHKIGFGDAIWTIIIGMIFSNTIYSVRRAPKDPETGAAPAHNLPMWLYPVVKPEFYIKISVVLLLTNFSEIGHLGLRGFLVASSIPSSSFASCIFSQRAFFTSTTRRRLLWSEARPSADPLRRRRL
eukprot:Opistho-2@78391